MTTRLVVALILALSLGHARAAEPVIVTLQERASVAGERLELGEIAGITGPAERAERLAAADIGPAPLPGQGRTLSLGYLKMRLRRWGLGEADVTFGGATEVLVSATPVAAHRPARAAEVDVGEPDPVAPAPVSVRRGSVVRLNVTCGGVTIVASATTVEDAAVGGIVKLRVDQTRQTTWATLESPTLARLTR